MEYGWIVLAGVAGLTGWAIWMVARALSAPSPPFGLGGYGTGPEANKRVRPHPKAS